jgi:PKD repeat protein
MTQSLEYGEFNTDFSNVQNFNAATLPPNRLFNVDMTYIHAETSDYPVNYGGNVIGQTDEYGFSHYIGGIDFVYEGGGNVFGVTAMFDANVFDGYAPFSVTFGNQSINASNYTWNFGDGTTSNERTPTHIFVTPGVYSVELTASNSTNTDATSKINYITVRELPVIIPCNGPFTRFAYGNDVQYVNLGSGTGLVPFSYNSFPQEDRYIITQGNQTLLDTGWVKNKGTRTFTKSSTDAYITASVLTKKGDRWTWTIGCPDS